RWMRISTEDAARVVRATAGWFRQFGTRKRESSASTPPMESPVRDLGKLIAACAGLRDRSNEIIRPPPQTLSRDRGVALEIWPHRPGRANGRAGRLRHQAGGGRGRRDGN